MGEDDYITIDLLLDVECSLFATQNIAGSNLPLGIPNPNLRYNIFENPVGAPSTPPAASPTTLTVSRPIITLQPSAQNVGDFPSSFSQGFAGVGLNAFNFNGNVIQATNINRYTIVDNFYYQQLTFGGLGSDLDLAVSPSNLRIIQDLAGPTLPHRRGIRISAIYWKENGQDFCFRNPSFNVNVPLAAPVTVVNPINGFPVFNDTTEIKDIIINPAVFTEMFGNTGVAGATPQEFWIEYHFPPGLNGEPLLTNGLVIFNQVELISNFDGDNLNDCPLMPGITSALLFESDHIFMGPQSSGLLGSPQPCVNAEGQSENREKYYFLASRMAASQGLFIDTLRLSLGYDSSVVRNSITSYILPNGPNQVTGAVKAYIVPVGFVPNLNNVLNLPNQIPDDRISISQLRKPVNAIVGDYHEIQLVNVQLNSNTDAILFIWEGYHEVNPESCGNI
jgi:hypothetical protein